MGICKNCKTAYEEGQLFCQKCGHPLTEEEHSQQPQETGQTDVPAPTIQENPSSRWSKQKMSKKNKVTLFSIIAIILLLIVGHLTMKSITNPTKIVTAMHEDFEKENAKAFLRHFDYDQKVHTDTEGFYDYIDEQSWPKIRSQLLNNLESLQKNGLADPVYDQNGNKIIKVVNKPMLGGLYHKVSFELVPIHVSVASDYDHVQFTSTDKTIELSSDEDNFLGDYLPGTYKWSAILKSQYGKIPFDGKMVITNAEDNEQTFTPDIEPSYVTIHSNNEDATIYVNGKSTKTTVYDSDAIGPLPLNGSVTAQAIVKDNNRTYKTDKVKVTDSDITLDFQYIKDQIDKEEEQQHLVDLVDEQYEDIEDFYDRFREAYESDVNNHIYDATSYYIVDGSQLEKDYQSYFPKFVDDDEIDNHTNEMSNLVALNDTTFKFDTNEDYTFYSHEGPTVDYSYKKTYTIQSSGDSYIIKAIDSEKISEDEYDE
ncbi:TcaA 3rd/4th domain-containing protein [Rummeliibacillus suwonensis]|uniref:TcaA 3rd/4th domain-containing protein n=1 Tax=Rummeliibacillus suwonensis TaxID=1306154 RepID=UPI001AAF916D|nr:hypothetical protein [Rummeliibacillus suwonensis]MBO2535699.1 hypothetical protein [Rummeliibacillus suwonensis]